MRRPPAVPTSVPATAPRRSRGLRGWRWIGAGIAVTLAVTLAVTHPVWPRHPDGIEILDAVVGPVAEVRLPSPPAWVPGWLRGNAAVDALSMDDFLVSAESAAEGDSLFVHVAHRPGAGPTATIAGDCGCRWTTAAVFGRFGAGGATVARFPRFPRRSAEWSFSVGALPPVTVPNPAPARPRGDTREADELPVSVRSGEETWILAPTSDLRTVVVRPLDARRSGFAWNFRSAHLRDASGNTLMRVPSVGDAREQAIRLPGADPSFHLCPHEPWWELTLDVAESMSVTIRFVPPRE